MDILVNYRYPGSRPFEDTELDRRLFFGRDDETQALLHRVFVGKFVVLFAKSGIGKSSLLRAGLFQPLRESGYHPLPIRFNAPNVAPLQTFYQHLEEQAQKCGDFTPGNRTSLRRYFETVEFWSAENTLLMPVVILDQFEEFFLLHAAPQRQEFIVELAALLRGGHTSENTVSSPDVKFIIALREEFLGDLEELAEDLPGILNDPIRLSPLRREQARQAIITPAELTDSRLNTPRFAYAPEAVETMLDFLSQHKDEENVISDDEIEPFQLQLLCQHIEQVMQTRSDSTPVVHVSDLGGENGMRQILEHFYDDQVAHFDSPQIRRKIQRLCEKGLISAANRRLSLEEEGIQHDFHLDRSILNALVNQRLLRAEPRVGSVYYELSHDTLIHPIRRSQKRRQSRRNRIGGAMACGIVALLAIIIYFALRPEASVRLYESAKQLQNAKQLAAAEQTYRDLVRQYPEFIQGCLEFGQLLSEQGRASEAMQLYQDALQRIGSGHPLEKATLYYEYGRILTEQDEFSNALTQYEKAIALNPNYAAVHIELGNSYRRLAKVDQEGLASANTSLERCQQRQTRPTASDETMKADEQEQAAAQVDGLTTTTTNTTIKNECNDPTALFNLKKTNEQALEEHRAKAIEHYQHALTLDQKNANAYKELALLHIAKQEGDQAVSVYRRAVQADVKHAHIYGDLLDALKAEEMPPQYAEDIYTIASDVQREDASYYANLADNLSNAQKNKAAVEIYHKAIRLNPNNRDYYNNLCSALNSVGEYDAAIRECQKALDIDPKYAYSSLGIGNALVNQGKYDEALAQYHQALTLDPQLAYAYTGIGDVFVNQGKYDEALAQYHQALKRDPQSASAYIGIGNVFVNQGKYDEALAQYHQALKLDPQSAYAYIGIGVALVNQGKYEEAIGQYQKALELNSMHLLAYVGLGDALRGQKKYDDAIRNYQEAIKIDANFSVAYAQLCGTYNDYLHKYSEAYEMCKKACSLEPANIDFKMNFAENSLVTEHFDSALTFAEEALQKQNLAPEHILSMKHIIISSLIFQGQELGAMTELKKFKNFYITLLSKDYTRIWNYDGRKNFIHASQKLTEPDKQLLLNLIDILESPKSEGEAKLNALEASLAERLRP